MISHKITSSIVLSPCLYYDDFNLHTIQTWGLGTINTLVKVINAKIIIPIILFVRIK